MNQQSNKQGAVLATTLIILFVLLLFSAVAMRINNQMHLRELKRLNETQAELMVYTGKSYLKSRLQKEQEQHQEFWNPLAYSGYPSQNQNLSFKIFSNHTGPWRDYWIEGRFLTGKKVNRQHKSYRLVQNLSKIPALTLLSQSASVSLAGDAKIVGDVAVKSGKVGKSYRYDLMSGPGAEHRGVVIDSTDREFWEYIEPDFSTTSRWVREHMLQLENQVLLNGDTCKNKVLYGTNIRIQGNSVLENCLIMGRDIQILQEKPFVESVLIATHGLSIDVRGEPSEKKTQVPTVFYLEATDEEAMMDLKAYPDVAVFAANSKQENGEERLGYHIQTGQDAKLQGLLITNGLAELRGEIRGSVIAANLRLKKSETNYGTIWQGFLWNASITKDSLIHGQIPAWTQMPIDLTHNAVHGGSFGYVPDSLGGQ